MQYRLMDTKWGWFGFVASKRGLVATYLPHGKREITEQILRRWPEATECGELMPEFAEQVREYFAGRKVAFTADLDLDEVPPFHAKVLRACRKVGFGKTVSYADLAKSAGKPNAARAVGGAMAHNPLPLVVPCHRVLRSDGGMGGFSSPRGINEKKRLLQLEGALPAE